MVRPSARCAVGAQDCGSTRWQGFRWAPFVNLLGGLLIGVALVWLDARPYGAARLFVMTGVLGGFTTFSAFSAESLTLLERGQWTMALAHTAAHVLGALACAAVGVMLARATVAGR